MSSIPAAAAVSAAPEDLSACWCNADAVTSSLMEAISLVTPELEYFVVGAVALALARVARRPDPERRYRAFIREESEHSRVHREFNAALLDYLEGPPPGLALVRSVLGMARKRLSVPNRLLLGAALEHFAAVLSRVYLNREDAWHFGAASARRLFAQHAREELAHRSVVFDLWREKGTMGGAGRAAVMLGILLGGLAYAAAAVPWILRRKTVARAAGLLALGRFALGSLANAGAWRQVRELFSFARSDFHPERSFQ